MWGGEGAVTSLPTHSKINKKKELKRAWKAEYLLATLSSLISVSICLHVHVGLDTLYEVCEWRDTFVASLLLRV